MPMNEHGLWVAHVNWGRIIATCPRPRCTWAYELKPGQDAQVCQVGPDQGCGYMGAVEWPEQMSAIITELQHRPVERDRNWAPAGHPQTFQSRTPAGALVAEAFPRGERLADIRAENAELEALPPVSATGDELVNKANEALAALGFSYDPDNPGQLRRL